MRITYLIHSTHVCGFAAIVKYHRVNPNFCIDVQSPSVWGLRGTAHLVHLHPDDPADCVTTPGWRNDRAYTQHRRRYLPFNVAAYKQIVDLLRIAHVRYLNGLRTYFDYRFDKQLDPILWQFRSDYLARLGRKLAPQIRIRHYKADGVNDSMDLANFEHVKLTPHWVNDPNYKCKANSFPTMITG